MSDWQLDSEPGLVRPGHGSNTRSSTRRRKLEVENKKQTETIADNITSELQR